MTSVKEPTELVLMLKSFIEDRDQARSMAFVRSIEGEFARLGLDSDEKFVDLQHSLAMYRGYEEDILDLKAEATFALHRLNIR